MGKDKRSSSQTYLLIGIKGYHVYFIELNIKLMIWLFKINADYQYAKGRRRRRGTLILKRVMSWCWCCYKFHNYQTSPDTNVTGNRGWGCSMMYSRWVTRKLARNIHSTKDPLTVSVILTSVPNHSNGFLPLRDKTNQTMLCGIVGSFIEPTCWKALVEVTNRKLSSLKWKIIIYGLIQLAPHRSQQRPWFDQPNRKTGGETLNQ